MPTLCWAVLQADILMVGKSVLPRVILCTQDHTIDNAYCNSFMHVQAIDVWLIESTGLWFGC